MVPYSLDSPLNSLLPTPHSLVRLLNLYMHRPVPDTSMLARAAPFSISRPAPEFTALHDAAAAVLILPLQYHSITRPNQPQIHLDC